MKKTFLGTLAIALAVAGAGIAAASATSVGTHNTKLGLILADRRGHTLYLFMHDRKGQSSCYGTCAQVWPPLLTGGKPVARSGVNSRLLGTTRRRDGKLQVTYNHHPLYSFAPDKRPGDLHGENVNGFGARWYVVDTSGNKVTPQSGLPGSY